MTWALWRRPGLWGSAAPTQLSRRHAAKSMQLNFGDPLAELLRFEARDLVAEHQITGSRRSFGPRLRGAREHWWAIHSEGISTRMSASLAMARARWWAR